MLGNVRILCDYLQKTLTIYSFLRKNRTLLAFFTVNRTFFQQSHNSGDKLKRPLACVKILIAILKDRNKWGNKAGERRGR